MWGRSQKSRSLLLYPLSYEGSGQKARQSKATAGLDIANWIIQKE